MTDEFPQRARRAFESHDAFESAERGYALETTRFDARISAETSDDGAVVYTLEVRAPTLAAATADEVGPAVEEGWFETYDRRLEDAPMAVAGEVDLLEQGVFEEAGDAVAVFEFQPVGATAAPDAAKAMAEYVEGTYVEGIVPGYEYEPPVSELLSRAQQSGGDDEGTRGPTPL